MDEQLHRESDEDKMKMFLSVFVKGNTGDNGFQGFPGLAGLKGVKGLSIPGACGPTGPKGTVGRGFVLYCWIWMGFVKWVLLFSDLNFFHFVGDKGVKGSSGPPCLGYTGRPGPPGLPGLPGTKVRAVIWRENVPLEGACQLAVHLH